MGAWSRSTSQVTKGAVGNIGGLQPRFGHKGVLYASETCAHTFELPMTGAEVVAYTAEEVATMKTYAELEGLAVGTFVTMAVSVAWTEIKEARNGPYVLATVAFVGGQKAQLRMWNRGMEDVPREKVGCGL